MFGAKQSASARTTPRYAVTTPATQYGHGASVPRGHWPPHLYISISMLSSCPDFSMFVGGDDEETLKFFYIKLNEQRLTIWALLFLCLVGNII